MPRTFSARFVNVAVRNGIVDLDGLYITVKVKQ
jgi:hypothetical protein